MEAGEEEKVEAIIAKIAVKNGVAVSKRDPIMIVHTMHNELLREGKAAQKECLDRFKSELEEIAYRWGEEAKSHAEKILNASLSSSKEAMANGMQEGASKAATDFAKIVANSTAEIEQLSISARRAAYINLTASILVIASVAIAFVTR